MEIGTQNFRNTKNCWYIKFCVPTPFIQKVFILLLVNVYQYFAQNAPPELISYQGVVRDASGSPMINKNIDIKLILHQGSVNGMVVFTEQHSVSTNSLGIFTLQIGKINQTGFKSIPWWNDSYFLEVQMDTTGNGNFVSIGTQQLLSVPYALYSKKAKWADSLSLAPGSVSPFWKVSGNNAINPSIHFLGTTDTSSLIFKTNNTKRMQINSDGRVRIIGSSSSPSSLPLFLVGGASTDTLLAAFIGQNSHASGIWIGNINPSGGSALVISRPNDTLRIASMPNKIDVYANRFFNLLSTDSIRLWALKRFQLKSAKDILISSPDSIRILSRTRVEYTVSPSIPTSAVEIKYNNNIPGAGKRGGILVEHTAVLTSSTDVSHGIYVNNNSNLGKIVGIGSYAINSNGEIYGIKSDCKGLGTNYGIYLNAKNGTQSMDGYPNWAIYSNEGNIMVKDGHIKTSSSNYTATHIVSSFFGSFLSPSFSGDDISGVIQFNIPSTSTVTLSLGNYYEGKVSFGQPYSSSPTVNLTLMSSVIGMGRYFKVFLTEVASTHFKYVIYYDHATTSFSFSNVTLSIYYHVIE